MIIESTRLIFDNSRQDWIQLIFRGRDSPAELVAEQLCVSGLVSLLPALLSPAPRPPPPCTLPDTGSGGCVRMEASVHFCFHH